MHYSENIGSKYFSQPPIDPYPYLGSSFFIEINGLIAGGFSEVTGLQVETEIEEIKEGGVNDFTHKLPKGTKYPNIVLKRGITDSDILWNWHQDVVDGIIERKSGSILLLDFEGNREIRWNFYNAYPVKWIGPNLNSKESSISIETLELAHNGIYRF